MYPYPTSCGEEAKALFLMLTGKTPVDLKVGVHSGWGVLGYCLANTIPDAPAVAAAHALDAFTDKKAIAVLAHLAGEDVSAGTVHAAAFGGPIGDALIKSLLPQLTAWLTNWLATGGLQKLLDKLLGGGTSPAPA